MRKSLTDGSQDDSHAIRMLEGRTITAVVPACNEAALIGGTLEAIPPYVDEVIVVDDGSTDGTVRAARDCSRTFDLVTHQTNLGVGAAIASGCKRAAERGADVAVVMAADGQMSPAGLRSVLRPLIDDQADFVKGNRLAWPAARRQMPFPRWVGNHALSWLTRRALATQLGDSQCGYVAVNRHALRSVRWDALWKGYGYPNDLLCEAMAHRLRIREVPVRPIYADERSGIRLRHALLVIPFVIARAWVRRRRSGAIEPAWPTSTSSTVMQTASVRSPSCATPTHDRAP
ncbi:MAG: glycosyltransferase family 2 protein [Deltaproteobacteria bacterium]|nr:glycosyltransferase family 2 protein [Deltaproteobacteria bacterium]